MQYLGARLAWERWLWLLHLSKAKVLPAGPGAWEADGLTGGGGAAVVGLRRRWWRGGAGCVMLRTPNF